jgi:hypothetical protein
MEMVKRAACVLVLLTAVAAAQDVQWFLTGPAQVNKGEDAAWQASVVVTGTNQGLAGYAFNVVVGPSPGPAAGADGLWGTADDENVAAIVLPPAQWPAVFKAHGRGPGSVKDTGAAGGPGLNVLPSAGSNAVRPGELLQVGAGCLFWTPWNGTDGQTAGVGRAESKAQLLADPGGAYVVNIGAIPTAALAAGTYVAMLVPVRTRVLRPDLDYAAAQPGFLMLEAAATPASFEFTVSVLPVPGDFNDDGYVNAADLDVFMACDGGPDAAYAAPCTLVADPQGRIEADFDRDGDVDSADFGVFQRCLSFDKPGNPHCAD